MCSFLCPITILPSLFSQPTNNQPINQPTSQPTINPNPQSIIPQTNNPQLILTPNNSLPIPSPTNHQSHTATPPGTMGQKQGLGQGLGQGQGPPPQDGPKDPVRDLVDAFRTKTEKEKKLSRWSIHRSMSIHLYYCIQIRTACKPKNIIIVIIIIIIIMVIAWLTLTMRMIHPYHNNIITHRRNTLITAV